MVAALDEVARESVAAGLVLGDARTALLAYDHTVLPGAAPGSAATLTVRRRVVDTSGVVYDDEIADGYDCACCRLRDDLAATLETLVGTGLWRRLVLAPPLGAPVADIARQLGDAVAAGSPAGVTLSAVLAVVDLDSLTHDLFGDDLLDERGSALSPHDRRAVGEAMVEHIEYADAVVAVNGPSPAGSAVLAHLAGDRWQQEWTRVDTDQLFGNRHDAVAAGRRADLLYAAPVRPPADLDGSVWTLDLQAHRPVHPERLLDRLADLGTGRIRSRGYLWLPSRPGTPCAWDGSGGQLKIGGLPGWGVTRPSTRLVVTGVSPGERRRIAAAFDDVLCTPAEAADASAWSGSTDGLDPWLGEIAATKDAVAGRDPA